MIFPEVPAFSTSFSIFTGYTKLVGGFNPSEKYYIVSWDHYSQYMEKSKMFQTTNQNVLTS